jgi:hypothetical protein
MAAAKPPSKKRKRQLDAMLARLAVHLATPEGIAKLKELREITDRIKARQANLSDRETKALTFIREELDRGHSPSVREITKAIGVRSSRTGHQIVQALLLRSLIRRDDNDLLALP